MSIPSDYKMPGTVTESTYGGIAWTNPNNVKVDNDGNLTTITLGPDEVSDSLNCTNFNFSVPTNSVILGFDVIVRASKSSSDNIVYFENVRGFYLTAPTGSSLISSATFDTPSTSLSYIEFSNKDSAGISLTAAMVNASTFGCSLAFVADSGNSGNITLSIDSVAMRVRYALRKTISITTYTAPSTITEDTSVGQTGTWANLSNINSTNDGVYGTHTCLNGNTPPALICGNINSGLPTPSCQIVGIQVRMDSKISAGSIPTPYLVNSVRNTQSSSIIETEASNTGIMTDSLSAISTTETLRTVGGQGQTYGLTDIPTIGQLIYDRNLGLETYFTTNSTGVSKTLSIDRHESRFHYSSVSYSGITFLTRLQSWGITYCWPLQESKYDAYLGEAINGLMNIVVHNADKISLENATSPINEGGTMADLAVASPGNPGAYTSSTYTSLTSVTSNFFVMAIIKTSTSGTNIRPIISTRTAGCGWMLAIGTTGRLYALQSQTSADTAVGGNISDASVADGNLHVVWAWFDTDTGKIRGFVDGVQQTATVDISSSVFYESAAIVSLAYGDQDDSDILTLSPYSGQIAWAGIFAPSAQPSGTEWDASFVKTIDLLATTGYGASPKAYTDILIEYRINGGSWTSADAGSHLSYAGTFPDGIQDDVITVDVRAAREAASTGSFDVLQSASISGDYSSDSESPSPSVSLNGTNTYTKSFVVDTDTGGSKSIIVDFVFGNMDPRGTKTRVYITGEIEASSSNLLTPVSSTEYEPILSGNKIGASQDDQERYYYSFAITDNPNLGSKTITLGGMAFVAFDLGNGSYAIGVHEYASSEATLNSGYLILNGFEMAYFELNAGENLLGIVLDDDDTLSDSVTIGGIPLGINPNKSILAVSSTGEPDDSVTIRLGGVPILCFRFGSDWYLGVATQ